MKRVSFMQHLRIGATVALIALGVAGCASNSNEARSRSIETIVDDQKIEFTVSDAIKKANPYLRDARVVITSFNGQVLLTGQVPNGELRQQAGQAAANQADVRRVFNELTIAPNATLSVRASDSLLTTKVRSQLWAEESIKDSKMKIITEDGTVYLLGLVSRQQADLAGRVTQRIEGVQKVVRLFEIIGE
jgi:osmotically-inducible protein OsmY